MGQELTMPISTNTHVAMTTVWWQAARLITGAKWLAEVAIFGF
jgi:hypothetical protein